MAEKKDSPKFPDLADPLEAFNKVIETINSVAEGINSFADNVDTRVRQMDEKTLGIDRRFTTPRVSEHGATRDIVDLVRSQFGFTCSICEDIAEKVSSKLPSRLEKTRVYEAVYQLTSGDKKAESEAIKTLGDLNVLKEVMDEIKESWEKLKA